jgi:hypothetical protein
MTPFSPKNFCCASDQSRDMSVIGNRLMSGSRLAYRARIFSFDGR